MENIELYVIGLLIALTVYYYFKNKENKYWRDYYKEQYFNEKDFNEKYIKPSIGEHNKQSSDNCAIFDVVDYVCPNCQSTKILDWLYDDELFCNTCSHRWAN